MDIPRIARRQGGVLTRAQALAEGLTPKQVRTRLDSGAWQCIHRGVYVTSSGAVTWTMRARAALLWCGPGSVLTLHSAAHLWRLQREPPASIDVGVPADRRPALSPGVSPVRRARLTSLVLHGLPVTRAPQTVIDLADLERVGLDDAVALAANACALGRVTVPALVAELEARSRHRHRRHLMLALGEIGDGAESLPEVWFVTRVQRPHGLPEFSRQVIERGGTRTDLKSARFGMNIEIDGLMWHAGERFHDDRRRDRRAAGRGEITLRVTFLELDQQPCDLATDIAQALQRRGWAGTPRHCRHCRQNQPRPHT